MRKAYLDNIRWSTVGVVVLYHVFYLFNSVGIPGGIPNAKNIPLFDTIAAMIYPWFMVLLFVVSGICARYSLQKRTAKQFLKERTAKLLVPSTLGLFVVHWVTGYWNIKIGGGLSDIPTALRYPLFVLSGIGPLWFIQLLYVFCWLLVLLKKLDKNDSIWTACGRIKPLMLPLLFLPIFGAAQILNAPLLTMYRFGIYFVSFLIGYYIFSHEQVQEMTKKLWLPMACLAVAAAIFYVRFFSGSDYTAPSCLQSLLTNVYLWLFVLAILGIYQKYFDFKTPFTAYLARTSFGIYILHYPILLTIGYLLQNFFDFPAICNYILAFAADILLTVAAYEILKRIPWIRYAVLGIRKNAQKTKRRPPNRCRR